MKCKILIAATFCGLITSASMVADEVQATEIVTYPHVEGEFIWEFQNDYTYKSDDPDAELNDTLGYLELAVSVVLDEQVRFNIGLIGESVLDPGPREDRFFGDFGVYIDTLNAQFNFNENTNVVVGKYAPTFGTAWDVTPGIYGADFAEDYELAEQIGLGFYHTFNGMRFGSVTLGANVFFADTTVLSESAFTNRGKTRLSDGGAGNTEELNNFSITLDGEELPELEGFAWHLGYRHLSAGLGDIADEQGFVAGLTQEVDLGDNKAAIFNLEFATFDNIGGSADDADYMTAGLTLVNGQWHADFSGTLRNTDVAGGPDVDDKLFQASIGYTDQHDIDWNVGYKYAEEGGVDSHTIGVFVTKAVEFSN